MIDICLVSIPYMAYTLPPAAPALLKGYVKSKGYTATVKDLNIAFRNKFNHDGKLNRLINYWKSNSETLDSELNEEYCQALEYASKSLLDTSARWIGISVFTINGQKFCEDLVKHIKKHNHNNTKIVIGGQGVTEFYAHTLKGFIDCYILGDGELALENLLQGNLEFPGINSPGKQVEDLDVLGVPDYTDYPLSEYDHFYDSPAVQLTGTRGCVRNCSFCNVPTIWPKFKFKSGHIVAQEIISIYETTGVRHFYFTDSLINGNLRELMSMMKILSEYRAKHNAPITWGGQWIVRKQQGLPADYYSLIKSSGGFNLAIGVETGSDAVREHMKKGFTNKDLDAEMEQFSKHNITCGFYLLVGYPTETEQDFKDTLHMIQRYTKYVADGTIVGCAAGSGFEPLEDTPIMKQKDQLWRWVNNGINKFKWVGINNSSSYIENIRRRIILQKVLDFHRWPATNIPHELWNLLRLLDEAVKNKTIVTNDIDLLALKDLTAGDAYMVKDTSTTAQVSIDLNGNQGQNWPIVEIYFNNQLIDTVKIVEQQTITFESALRHRNMLKIRLVNKTLHDTIVENNLIVKDKNVQINEIVINGIRVRKDSIYTNGKIKDQSRIVTQGNGLYFNSTFNYYFQSPIEEFFIKRMKFYFEKELADNTRSIQKLSEYYMQLRED